MAAQQGSGDAGHAALSPDARQRIEEELRRLRERRDVLRPNLSEGNLGGDRADQADVLEQAEDAAWLDRRIAELSDLLTHGEAPAADAEGTSTPPYGSRVTLRFPDGSKDTLRVIGIAEEAPDDEQALTADSPLGQAIAGHGEGDTVSYRTPRGETTAEIVKVRKPKR